MKTNKIKAAIESLLTELKNEILSSDEPTPTSTTQNPDIDLTTVQEDLRDIRTELTYITDNVDDARTGTISDLPAIIDEIENSVSNITSMIDDLISKLDDA